MWFKGWDSIVTKSLMSCCPKAAEALYGTVLEKVSFSRVLADNLCVLVTTPPSSNVPFSAHMLPIRQSDLHDVSLCMCVYACSGNGRETSPAFQM